MRKPRRDDRWDRTLGGLIVPRRVGLPTRRFIQKWGTAKCCCNVVLVPDDTCPICATGTLPGAYLYNDETVCGYWTPATRYVGLLDIYSDPGYPASCSKSTVTFPSLAAAVYEDGSIAASYAISGGTVVSYKAAYFTGDPPFDCNGIEDLELPFLSVNGSGCGSYPASVWITLT